MPNKEYFKACKESDKRLGKLYVREDIAKLRKHEKLARKKSMRRLKA